MKIVVSCIITYIVLLVIIVIYADKQYDYGYKMGKLDASIAVLNSKQLKPLEALRCSYIIDEGKIPNELLK